MCSLSSVNPLSVSLARVAENLALDVALLQAALDQTARETRLSRAICLDLLDRMLSPTEQTLWQSRAMLDLLELEWSSLREPDAALITVQQSLYQLLSHSGALQP